MTEFVIEISQEHTEHCERVVEQTEFETIEEYIRYILDEIMENTNESSRSDHDRDRNVSDQLESLGYL